MIQQIGIQAVLGLPVITPCLKTARISPFPSCPSQTQIPDATVPPIKIGSLGAAAPLSAIGRYCHLLRSARELTHRLMIAVYRQLVRFKVTDSAHTAEMSVCPHSRAPDPSPRQTESLPFRTACTPVYSSAPHRALLLYSRHF